MILLLDTCQGRKWAGVPWPGEALESLPTEGEGKKGKRAGWSLPHSMFCFHIKLSGNMILLLPPFFIEAVQTECMFQKTKR